MVFVTEREYLLVVLMATETEIVCIVEIYKVFSRFGGQGVATLAFHPAIVKRQTGVELLSNLVGDVTAAWKDRNAKGMGGMLTESGRCQTVHFNSRNR